MSSLSYSEPTPSSPLPPTPLQCCRYPPIPRSASPGSRCCVVLLPSRAFNKTISPPDKSRKNLRIRRGKAEPSQTINKRPQLFIRRTNRRPHVQTDPSRVFTQPGPEPLALSDKAHVYEKNDFKTTQECKYQSGLSSWEAARRRL